MRCIDSHTAGEPTRLILDPPRLGGETVAEKAKNLDPRWCRRVLCEPRGHEAFVGAILLPPDSPDHHSGLLFFNNVGALRMCGHGTIGVVATLGQNGELAPGTASFSTPVGAISVELFDDLRTVSMKNVPSRRGLKNFAVTLESGQVVTGDVAFGGNWFFLTHDMPAELELKNLRELTDFGLAIRRAIDRAADTADELVADILRAIDHVEITGAPHDPANSGRNFVLCPGGEYDRSPCGTGTSAKVACLAEDGELKEGEIWRQESILGTVFEAKWESNEAGLIRPIITGQAYITARTELVFDDLDPLRGGIQR